MNRQYYGIEDLALTTNQRDTLIDALKKLGRQTSRQPAHITHWRIRDDNRAVIFEGFFNDDEWTVESMTNRLANLFGVNPTVIDTNVTQTPYGPMITFGAGGTNRMRMIAFGGLQATWNESHDLVLQYLSNNASEWDGE